MTEGRETSLLRKVRLPVQQKADLKPQKGMLNACLRRWRTDGAKSFSSTSPPKEHGQTQSCRMREKHNAMGKKQSPFKENLWFIINTSCTTKEGGLASYKEESRKTTSSVKKEILN